MALRSHSTRSRGGPRDNIDPHRPNSARATRGSPVASGATDPGWGEPGRRVMRTARARRDVQYRQLAPLLDEYAAMEPSDPRRPPLRDQLVRGYLPLARHIALRFHHRGEPLEDLTQVATLGLIFAIDRFQPAIGSEFLAFAVPTIVGELRRHFRDRCWSMRVHRGLKDLYVSINRAVSDLSQQRGQAPRPSEIAELLDRPVEDVLEGLKACTAYRTGSLDEPLSGELDGQTRGERLGELDPNLELVEDHEALMPLLAALPERERSILLMRFYGNMTQTQISTRIGISQMHVSRLLASTLTALHEQLSTD
jgi:RNA polymerase sigma-B factor